MLSKMKRLSSLQALLEVARDLTASLAAEDRYSRLLAAVRRVVPCDAACLLRLEDHMLVPLAAHGLTTEALGQRFLPGEHPRLDAILRSERPVRFPADSPLADPYDGLMEADAHALSHVHDCMGCRLTCDGEVVGALTADALSPSAFDAVDLDVVETLAALAGAAMRTTRLIEAIERAAFRSGEVAKALQREAWDTGERAIVGHSAAVRRLHDEIRTVAGTDYAVLITGETGVGKELVAREVHRTSRRSDEPLIQVNCAALPESIAESELFGHVAGAFTGAVHDRAGKFEIADGGTLLLDEVGELPLGLQPKLLRALQEGEIQRVGSDRPIHVNVRILAATNRDLEHEVAAGRFRADLYHRLAVYPVHVPPLRERSQDVPLLAARFLDAGRKRLGLGVVRLTEEARASLSAFDWPGNVRELENVVSRGLLRAARAASGRPGPIRLDVEHLDLAAPRRFPGVTAALRTTPGRHAGAASAPPTTQEPIAALADQVDEFRRQVILAAVRRNDGNWSAAARELGLHRSNLHHLGTRLGLREV